MAKINRDLWTIESFSYKKPPPPWICPICNLGILNGDKTTLKIEHTEITKKARRSPHLYLDHEIANFRFAGFMICENNRCKERIAIAGKGELYAVLNDEPVGIKYQGERYSVYIPKYFDPPLNVFLIPESCPDNIKKQIKKSFSHFFNDLNACANAIRTSLELIMDEQRIPNINDKSKAMYLSQRIEKFNKVNPEIKPFIEAVKWIGNAGSHIEDVDKDAILDGYELLMYVIDELYDKMEVYRKLRAKANEINSTKKPLSK